MLKQARNKSESGRSIEGRPTTIENKRFDEGVKLVVTVNSTDYPVSFVDFAGPGLSLSSSLLVSKAGSQSGHPHLKYDVIVFTRLMFHHTLIGMCPLY